MILERKRLQARIEVRAQAQQGFEADSDEEIVGREADQSAKQTHQEKNDAEPQGDLGGRHIAKPPRDEFPRILVALHRICRQHPVDNVFKRPRLE